MSSSDSAPRWFLLPVSVALILTFVDSRFRGIGSVYVESAELALLTGAMAALAWVRRRHVVGALAGLTVVALVAVWAIHLGKIRGFRPELGWESVAVHAVEHAVWALVAWTLAALSRFRLVGVLLALLATADLTLDMLSAWREWPGQYFGPALILALALEYLSGQPTDSFEPRVEPGSLVRLRAAVTVTTLLCGAQLLPGLRVHGLLWAMGAAALWTAFEIGVLARRWRARWLALAALPWVLLAVTPFELGIDVWRGVFWRAFIWLGLGLAGLLAVVAWQASPNGTDASIWRSRLVLVGVGLFFVLGWAELWRWRAIDRWLWAAVLLAGWMLGALARAYRGAAAVSVSEVFE